MALSEEARFKLEQTIEACKEEEAWDMLSEWEQGFLTSTDERFKQYGDGTRFSDKQWAVIERIYEKVAPK